MYNKSMKTAYQYLVRLFYSVDRQIELLSIFKELACSYEIIPSKYLRNSESYAIHFGTPWKNLVVAHYDTAGERIGANDNLASVAELLGAIALIGTDGHFPPAITFVFVDGEERLAYGSPDEMGSYAVAEMLFESKTTHESIYVLDCCGYGDQLIYSTPGLDEASQKLIDRLKICAPELVGKTTPPSDNYSFKTFGFNSLLVSTCLKQDIHNYPATWANIHCERDNLDNTQSKTLEKMAQIVHRLALTN